jgi:hypothetical protein
MVLVGNMGELLWELEARLGNILKLIASFLGVQLDHNGRTGQTADGQVQPSSEAPIFSGDELTFAVKHTLALFHNSLMSETLPGTQSQRMWAAGFVGDESLEAACGYLKGLHEGIVNEILISQHLLRDPNGIILEYRYLASELGDDKPMLFALDQGFIENSADLRAGNDYMASRIRFPKLDDFVNLGRMVSKDYVDAIRINPDNPHVNVDEFKTRLNASKDKS